MLVAYSQPSIYIDGWLKNIVEKLDRLLSKDVNVTDGFAMSRAERSTVKFG